MSQKVRKKRLYRFALLNLLLALFISIGIHKLLMQSGFLRLNEDTVATSEFRSQSMNDEMLSFIKNTKDPGQNLGLYWLETNFGTEPLREKPGSDLFEKLHKKWASRQGWSEYAAQCRGIWNDVKYFPIPEPKGSQKAGVSYVDSWMFDRNYGGRRGHEGTDVMAEKNEPGLYPVVSMTDGVVRHKGWLEKGGYRLGIVSPGGAYFYYAHLDSYGDIQEGDQVKAGDLLGYMGDTGYGKKEGTRGNFPVHLHAGIYLFHGDEEISVNPYWVLRYLEDRKIKCKYSQ